MKGQQKQFVGRVTSNAMEKTVVVTVERLKRHPLYGKTVRERRKFKAHDAESACQLGDLVRILESRPLSKEKRWVVAEILERAE